MAVTNRGSILISTANDIGSSLVDVIGGEGYSPNEWSKEVNICGIAAADIPTALDNIEESTPSGTDRGDISLDTANAVGAVLNKKFNTARGFKPSEWASAISKLTELEIKTASGAIASFNDGADDVPTKSVKVSLPASLSGVSSVTETQTGRNLFDKDNANVVNGYVDVSAFNTGNANAKTIYIPIKGGVTYTVSKTVGARFSIATSDVIPTSGATYTSRQAGNTSASLTITAGANDTYLWAWIFLEGTDTGTFSDMLASIQIEVGSTAHAYEPYQTPTTYTASLGRTIYGGTADVVNGTGKSSYGNIDMGTLTWQYDSANTRFFTVGLVSVIKRGTSGWITDLAVDAPYTVASGTQNDKTISEYASTGYVYIKDTDYTDTTAFKASLSGKYLTYPLATPTDFTFTPITPTPKTALGVNNFWADSGDSEVKYRADIDLDQE